MDKQITRPLSNTWKWGGGGGSGYLYLNNRPPVDWETAINVDMVNTCLYLAEVYQYPLLFTIIRKLLDVAGYYCINVIYKIKIKVLVQGQSLWAGPMKRPTILKIYY